MTQAPDRAHPLTSDARAEPAPDRRTVVRELSVFLAVQTALTAVTTAVALREHVDVIHIDEASALGQGALYLSAFFPLVAALVARRVVHGRVRWAGWGLRRPTVRAVGLAWGVTLAAVLGSGLLVWVTGVGAFTTAGGLVEPALGLTVLVLPYALLALGEEIGWRGLVVTRLAQVARPRTVVLASGLTWSAFHWPMILFLGGTPDGVAPLYAVAMFTVSLTAFSAVLAGIQLRWGVWPVCVAHAVWNATLYQVVEPLTTASSSTPWFSTETGLFLAATSVLAALLWWRRFPLRATPAGTTIP